ncbi:RNA-directed DNA polymerase, eukaryota [Tanacetum coccineum]
MAIRGVLVKGDWYVKPSIMKKGFLNHFSNRFSASVSPKITLQAQFPKYCGTNKSPGPDGFSYEFFRRYWDIIDQDVVVVGLIFFSTGCFPPGCNSSFIALIPEMKDVKMVKDFGPIGLIGSMYKIIAKILANRLSLVILDLVSDVQSSFASNRQILDGPFILNELFSWYKRKNSKAMIFKVDFEKAFDSVIWDFLDEVLHKFRFGDKWRGWIQGCLSSVMGSILVNGSPTSEFKFYKGLKQGDPLSPFLFILIMKSLYFSFENILNAGLYKGIHIDDSLSLSHLLYVDNVVFVVATTASSIRCATLTSPFNYLVVKVGGKMSRLSSWDEVIVKISSRLSKWKLKTLSVGGRYTLIKSVLSSFPLHYFSIFKVPKGILNKMEAFRRNFFNGADIADRKMSLIGWKKILALKKNEGLVGNGDETFFWNDVWIADFSLKHLFLRLYSLELDKLPTRLNLSIRGLDIPSILCPICYVAMESTTHILFSCDMARQLMCKVARWWEVEIHDINSYGDWLFWFSNLRFSKRLNEMAKDMEVHFDMTMRQKAVFEFDAICPVCRKACLDSFGKHAVHCKELPGFKYRHDMVRDVLFDICRRAGISAKKAAPVNFLTDPLDGRFTLKPANVLVFGLVGGKHACVNLIGVSPLVGLSSRGFTAGQAALKAASCKVTIHEKTCIENQHVFILFAFDTFGFLALEAVELLSRV